MNREDASIAATNILPPLIAYDVAIPSHPTSTSASLLCGSLSLLVSHSQCLWGIYDSSEAVSRSRPPRAAEYFTAPDLSNAPLTRFHPCWCWHTSVDLPTWAGLSFCSYAAASSHALPNISLSHLQSEAVLNCCCRRRADQDARVLLSICRCWYLLWIDR